MKFARLRLDIWVVHPCLDYCKSQDKIIKAGKIGDLISVADTWEGAYSDCCKGTLLEGPYKDYYATDLEESHFTFLSPLEMLALQAED